MNDGEESLQNNDPITLYMHIYDFFLSINTNLTNSNPAR